MRRLLPRLRPSPALAVALVALFCSLGGVSYGLATGSITGREIRNNTIRSRDVHNSSLRGRDVRNNSLTGRDIAEATLGTVPNADRVDGLNMAPLNVRLPAGSPTRTVLGFGGLILNATCKANGDLDLSATTAANNAMVHVASITQGATPHYDQDNDLDVGQSVNALPGGQTGDNEVQATLTYAAPGTSVVSVRYMAQHGDNLLSSPNDCFVLGSADQSG